jgi:hypothetical protein
MGAVVLLCVLLVAAHWILRILITGDEELQLPEDGQDANLIGKIILALIGVISSIIIILVDGVEGEMMKWFWMIFIFIALGFQAFIEWKYLKGSKRYLVSVIVCLIGVGLANLLL